MTLEKQNENNYSFWMSFLTGIKVKDNAVFTSSVGEKCIFSNMPIHSVSSNYAVLFLWQPVDVTVIKRYNGREQRRYRTGRPQRNQRTVEGSDLPKPCKRTAPWGQAPPRFSEPGYTSAPNPLTVTGKHGKDHHMPAGMSPGTRAHVKVLC